MSILNRESILSFVTPENFEKEFNEGRTEHSFEYRISFEAGVIIWIHSKIKLLRNPVTSELIAYCYHKNINDRKISESLIKNIAEIHHDYIMYIDGISDTYILYNYSKSSSPVPPVKTASYDKERIKNTYSYVIEEEREHVIKQMSIKNVCHELEDKKIFSLYIGVLETDGSVSRKRLSYSYINKKEKLISLTRTDVTSVYEEQQAKKKVLSDTLVAAQQANLAKTEFLSRMSHEMRTPMNVIMGLASLVQQQVPDDPVLHENLGKINTSAQYLLSIINDVLDMSRIESGKMALVEEKIVIKDFLERVNTIIKSQAEAKGLQYTSTISDEVYHTFLGDSTKLQQVLINILGNAIKFTPSGGEVSLFLEQINFLNAEQKRKLCFTVSDTGIGIDKKFIPYLFDSFTQQDTGISSVYGGTGLGLAITKNIVTMMGGSISVKNREDKGTVFTVEVVLPIFNETQQQGVTSNRKWRAKNDIQSFSSSQLFSSDFFKGKRILLVDDNEMNIDVAKQLLAQKGFIIDIARNGREAVDLFTKSQDGYYCAILMDVRMPVMDGLTATKKIRELSHPQSKKIPIIAMTANAFIDDIRQTQESGMNAHLSKPIVLMFYTIQ